MRAARCSCVHQGEFYYNHQLCLVPVVVQLPAAGGVGLAPQVGLNSMAISRESESIDKCTRSGGIQVLEDANTVLFHQPLPPFGKTYESESTCSRLILARKAGSRAHVDSVTTHVLPLAFELTFEHARLYVLKAKSMPNFVLKKGKTHNASPFVKGGLQKCRRYFMLSRCSTACFVMVVRFAPVKLK
jgi:hypothetical protein